MEITFHKASWEIKHESLWNHCVSVVQLTLNSFYHADKLAATLLGTPAQQHVDVIKMTC